MARSFPESKTCKLFVACSGICLTCSQQSSCPCHAPDPHHHTHPLPLPSAALRPGSIYLPRPWARITGPSQGDPLPRAEEDEIYRHGYRQVGPVQRLTGDPVPSQRESYVTLPHGVG